MTNEPDNLSVDVQKAIILQEIETHLALRYRLEVRHRVNVRIKTEESVLKAINADLEKIELALDAYKAELQELE